MNLLVTGCAGFIGFHTCKRILANKNVKITLFGKEVYIDRALEPSLYIWENMAITHK